MKYYILIRNNKIIKAGNDWVKKVEHTPEGDIVYTEVGEVYENLPVYR